MTPRLYSCIDLSSPALMTTRSLLSTPIREALLSRHVRTDSNCHLSARLTVALFRYLPQLQLAMLFCRR
jgi:hypothetical protein